jgi:D-galactose 1-dehydrogenase
VVVRIAVVGLGKIAHDQHLPAIAASPDFTLVAGMSPQGSVPGVPVYRDLDALLAGQEEIDAIAMCQPPQVRFDAAARALRAGKHVLLEKPPGATLAEVRVLTSLAERMGVTLFAAWHSRFAPGVAPARSWLADKRVTRVEIVWKEDVRRWHPGQQWIWQAGGMGVFDPGINALSIATRILPDPIFLRAGTLELPENREAPIAASLAFSDVHETPITAEFDWRQEGPQTWDIRVETDAGALVLEKGGSVLTIDGAAQPLGAEAEYSTLYKHFADLIAGGASDVDRAPLRHVADAFFRADRRTVTAFVD